MKRQNKGKIVLIGSDQSVIGKGRITVYGATKGAIAQITKGLAIDYATHNININCVCPGTIDTPLYHKAVARYCELTDNDKQDVYDALAKSQPIQRVGKAEEVAALVLFLCGDQSNFMTGSLYPIDGGYCAQ